MLAEVRKCADNHDIKGLRYIFVDALDVDPTFEKYQEDYEYCKKIPGMFDNHTNMTSIVDDKSKWTMEYWEQMKLDLMKNFSERRFEHMISVAKVVYADKINRLITERGRKIEDKQSVSVSENVLEIAKAPVVSEKKVVAENPQVTSTPNQSTVSQADKERQRIEAQQKALAMENSRIEAEQRAQRERIEAARRAEIAKQGVQTTGTESKKALGIALAVITAVVVVVLIIVVLH